MNAENKLEDSELLKQKMQEGYRCVLQGRAVYQLKTNDEGIVSAIPWNKKEDEGCTLDNPENLGGLNYPMLGGTSHVEPNR